MKKIFLLGIFLIFIIEFFFNIITIGKYLFESKQYKIAVEIFKKMDYKEESQYYLWQAYFSGLGVNKDFTKAFQYAEKLASNNNSFGFYILGLMYNHGYGTKKDIYKALSYYKKSLSVGNYLGHIVNLQIAKIYEFENEIGINFNEAEKYYLESIKFGNYESYIFLGNLYEFKIKDLEKAKNSYLRALEYDLNKAYYFLALMYFQKNDIKQSIVYYEKAIEKKVSGTDNCFLAYLYENIDRTRSYDLAFNEINNKNEDKELLRCYEIISMNYIFGDEIYFPEINDESIMYFKLIDKYSDKNFYYADRIAHFYYLQKDFNNSKIWYQKAYEYKNDEIFKNKIEKIDKDIQNIIINENKLFPIINDTIINSPNNKILETEKYYFISNYDKSIIVYNKETKNVVNILRSYINNDNSVIGAFAYDEKKELLYVLVDDIGLINVFDIHSGKVVDVIKNENDYIDDNLVLSKDGKILINYSKSGKLKLINIENKKFQKYNFSTINVGIDKIKIELNSLDYLIYVKTLDNYLYTFSYNHKRRINKEKFNNQIIFDEINVLPKSIKINDSKIEKIVDLSYMDSIIKINFSDKIYNFNLKNLKIESNSSLVTFKKDSENINSNYKVKFFHNNGIMKIYNSSGKFISKISLLFKGCEYYKIIDDKYIIIFTKSLSLSIYI